MVHFFFPNSQKRNNQLARRPQQNQLFQERITRLPTIPAAIQVTKTYRYKGGTAGNGVVIYAGDLLSMAGVAGSSALVWYSLFAGAKLRSVRIIAPYVAGSSNTVALAWGGNEYASAQSYEDTTLSAAVPAIITRSPPKDSRAALWQSTPLGTSTAADEAMFSVTWTAGSFIDVTVTHVIVVGANGYQFLGTSTPGAGFVGYAALDTLAGTTYLTPVGLTQA